MKNYVTVKEAAGELGITVAATYEAIRRGTLTATRVLGKVAIERKDLDARKVETADVGKRGGRPKRRKEGGA